MKKMIIGLVMMLFAFTGIYASENPPPLLDAHHLESNDSGYVCNQMSIAPVQVYAFVIEHPRNLESNLNIQFASRTEKTIKSIENYTYLPQSVHSKKWVRRISSFS